MAEMDRLIALERAKLDRGRRVEAPWWLEPIASAISNIPIQLEKTRMYTGNKLDDTYTALTNLLKVSDSEEGMKIYDKKLGEFAADSTKLGGFEDNIVQAETLKLLGNQKKKMYRNFSTAIQNTSDFINTPEFLDKADEFVNMQDTIDDKGFKGSVTDFLQSELANANALYDNMVSGFQIQGDQVVGTNFRYNQAETNDKEAFRKLQLYRDRLDLATKSLAGDGKISAEEAKAIIIGDSTHYSNQKNAALRKAESNYKANKSMVVKYDGLINSAKQKMLSADDIFNMEGLDDASKLEMGGHLTAGSWDKIVQQLVNEKAEYTELRNIANENYKNWYGSYFEEVKGGMTQEEIEKFNLELGQKQKELEEKKKIEEQKKLEETKQRYEEPKEEVKVQTYSIDEKSDAESLLTGYIDGNVSDSVLRNIGGQSLLNRARVMKNAYKGQLPKATVIPGVKTKGITPVGIETLKGTDFKNPGKSGTFSFEDITSEIHSSGKAKTEKGTSIAEQYLSDKVDISDLKIRWRGKRESVEALKNKFKKLGISLEEFKENYSKDYRTLVNLLAKSRNK